MILLRCCLMIGNRSGVRVGFSIRTGTVRCARFIFSALCRRTSTSIIRTRYCTCTVGLEDKYAEIRSGNHGEEVIALSQVL
jgi:hypothetical protein